MKGIPLEEVKDKENKSIYPTISEAFDNFVKYQEMKLGSKNNHRITKNVLIIFCESYRKEVIIDKISYDFLLRFVKYLLEDRAIPNKQNTIAKRLKLLNTALRFSNRRDKFKLEDLFVEFSLENRIETEYL